MSHITNGDYVRVPLFEGDGNSGESDSDHGIQINNAPTPVDQKETSPCGLHYYQKFFDVDSHQVFERLKMSLIPLFAKRFVQNVQPNGDLYGPFWVVTTLIVSALIGGDVSLFLMPKDGLVPARNHFGKVTSISMLIYAYWWILPSVIMVVLYLRKRHVPDSDGMEDSENLITDTSSGENTPKYHHASMFFQLLCIYGYSLTVFIPTTLLWGVSNSTFQWILLALAVAISGGFLFFVLLPVFRRDRPVMAVPTIVTILVIHVIFAAVLLLLFSHGAGESAHTLVPQPGGVGLPDSGAVKQAIGNPAVKDALAGKPVEDKKDAIPGKA